MTQQKNIEDIVLQTNKHCFLCWGQVSDPASSSTSTYPIHHLSQYLKLDGINLNKVVSGNDTPSQLQHHLTQVRESRSRLKVTLCEECARLNAKISELFRQLRKIEMEALFYLTLIHGKLRKMTNDKKNDRGVPRNLKEGDLEGFMLGEKLEIAKGLRMEAMEKCSQKIARAHPRINVRKLTGSQVLSEKLKIKRNTRIRPHICKPNYKDWSDSENISFANSEGAQGYPGVLHLNELIWSEISKSEKFEDDPKPLAIKRTELDEDRDPPSKFIPATQRLSTAGRSYPCKFCQKPFSDRSNRRRHIRSYCSKRKFKVAAEPPKVQKQKLYEIMKSCVPAHPFGENHIVNEGRGLESQDIKIKQEPPEPNESAPGHVYFPAVVSEDIKEPVPSEPITTKTTDSAPPLEADPDMASSKPYKLRRRQTRKEAAPPLDDGDEDINDDTGSNYSANLSPPNVDSEDSPEPEPPSKPETKKKFKSAAGNKAVEGAEPWHTENGKHKCNLCPFESGRIREARRHYGIVHLNKFDRRRNYKCKLCGKAFSHQFHLNYHHKRVHLQQLKCESEGPCPCPDCGRIFCNTFQLRLHVEGVHDRVKRHVCQQCGKSFVSSWRLQTHVTQVHLQVKGFVCEECGKCFHSNANLQRHRGQVHLGKRENICEQCGNSFAQPSTLKTHIKLAHSEQYDFGCDLCDKRFKLKMYMQQHRRSAHKSVEETETSSGPGDADVARNVSEELVTADQGK